MIPPDRPALGGMALAAAIAALITGLVDGSAAWLVASAFLLALWALLYIFSVFPSTYSRSVQWLDHYYQRTSPRPAKAHLVPPPSPPRAMPFEDTIFGNLAPELLHSQAIVVDPSNLPEAAAKTDTDETVVMKKDALRLFCTLDC